MTVISPWPFSVRNVAIPIANVLTSDHDSIVPPQTSKQQNVEPNPFLCAERALQAYLGHKNIRGAIYRTVANSVQRLLERLSVIDKD